MTCTDPTDQQAEQEGVALTRSNLFRLERVAPYRKPPRRRESFPKYEYPEVTKGYGVRSYESDALADVLDELCTSKGSL